MTLLLALLIILASASPALAEPITLSIAAAVGLGGVVTAGSIAASIGTALIGTAVAVGASLLVRALAPKVKEKQEAAAETTGTGGTELTLSANPSQPRALVLGTRATAGSLVYWCTSGLDNQWLTMVIALADHQCQSLERIWVDGKLVSWAPTAGAAASGHIGIPEYNGYLTVAWYDGSPLQYADGVVIADCPLRTGSATEKEWTTAHALNGVAYVVVKCGWDTAGKQWQGGGVPQLLFELRGAKLYDPRKDSTSPGGSGAHRWSTPSTYEWTENLEVARYNYLRGIAFGADGQPLFGVGLAPTAIDLNRAIAAMNSCDEIMTLQFPAPPYGFTTEYRYRVSAVVTSEMTHRTVLEKLALACGGDVPDLSGRYALTPGMPQIAVASITDDDLLVGEELVGSRHTSRREKANEVVGQWSNPEALYQRVDVPARWSDVDEELDGGFRNAASFDLEFVASQTQGQRVLEIMRRLERRQQTYTITLSRKFAYLEAGDWIVWNSDVFGLVEAQFRIEQVSLHPDWRITLNLREIDNAAYAWDPATDEIDPANPRALASGGPDIETVAGFAVAMVTVTGPNGEQLPGLQCTWTAILDPTVVAILIEYRRVGDTPWKSYTWPFPASGVVTITDGIIAGSFYEARATPICEPPRRVQVTVPVATGTVAPSVIVTTVKPGGITYTQLDEDLQTAIDGIGGTDDPPGIPTGLGVTSTIETLPTGETQTVVKANWNDLVDPNFSYYSVEIAEGAGSFIAFSTDLSEYYWRGIKPGTIVHVRVRAYSKLGNISGYSAVVDHPVAANTTPPLSATLFTGTGAFQTVFLNWSNPPDPDHAETLIYENAVSNNFATATLVGTEAAPGNTYVLTGRIPGTTYYYWIRTKNTSGVLSVSTTPASATAGLEVTTVTLAMTDFGIGLQPVQVVSTLPTFPVPYDGQVAFLTTDKKIYRYNVTLGTWVKSVDGQDILANTITAGAISAGAITAEKLAVGTYPINLVPNASFEPADGGILPWYGQASHASEIAIRDTTRAFAGAACVRINKTTGSNWGAISLPADSFIPCEPGQVYEGSAAASGSANSPGGGWYMTVSFYDRFKTSLGSQAQPISNAPITTSFVLGSGKFTVPVGAGFMSVTIYNNTESTSQHLYVDDIGVKRAMGATIIQDGAIITQHMTANTILGDRIQAGTLNADKIQAATTISKTVVVQDGTSLENISANSTDPATRINSFTTLIDPGKVLISGATTLSSWRYGTDLTKIEGGSIAANTVAANKLFVGNRGIGIKDLNFSVAKATGVVSWSAGAVTYTNDAGTPVSINVNAGTFSSGGALTYFYWPKGSATVGATTDITLAQGADSVILATYSGAAGLNAFYGNTIIDGDRILTNTIQANRIQANSITASQLSTGELITVSAQIKNLTVETINIATGAISDIATDENYDIADFSLAVSPTDKIVFLATAGTAASTTPGGGGAVGRKLSLFQTNSSGLLAERMLGWSTVVTGGVSSYYATTTTFQYIYFPATTGTLYFFAQMDAFLLGYIVNLTALKMKR